MLTTASTSRTGRSILEAAVGQPIVHFQDLWLAGRLLAPEGEEADLVRVQKDGTELENFSPPAPFTARDRGGKPGKVLKLTADQAVGPHLAQLPGLPQQGHLAAGVAAPQV